jgi:hypothetical protein
MVTYMHPLPSSYGYYRISFLFMFIASLFFVLFYGNNNLCIVSEWSPMNQAKNTFYISRPTSRVRKCIIDEVKEAQSVTEVYD